MNAPAADEIAATGARLGRSALACSVLALALEPAAVLVAVGGTANDATAGWILLTLGAGLSLSLAALVLGLRSLRRLRGAPDRLRLASVVALVLAGLGLPGAVVAGVVSLIVASKGGWIWLS